MINIDELINFLIGKGNNSNVSMVISVRGKKEQLKGLQTEYSNKNKITKTVEKICSHLEFNEESKNEYIDLAKVFSIYDQVLNPLQITSNYKINDIFELIKNKSLMDIIYGQNLDEIEMLKQFYIYLLEDAKKLCEFDAIIEGSINLVPEYIKYKTENPMKKEAILRDYKQTIAHNLINRNEAKDSYLEIAHQFGIKISDLYRFNGININHNEYLKPNSDYIKIPTKCIDMQKIKVPYDIMQAFDNGVLNTIPDLKNRRDYNYLTEMVTKLNYLRDFKFIETLNIIDNDEMILKIFDKYPFNYQVIMAPVFREAGNLLDTRIDELRKHKTKIKI